MIARTLRRYIVTTRFLLLLACGLIAFLGRAVVPWTKTADKIYRISKRRPPLVLVHVGYVSETLYPRFIVHAVRQALLWNPALDVYVVTQGEYIVEGSLLYELQSQLSSYRRKGTLTLVDVEHVPMSRTRLSFLQSTNTRVDVSAMDGFWRHTADRLFVLSDFMAWLDLDELFHIENDNMVYMSFEQLLPILRSKYKGMAATSLKGRHKVSEVTAGFLYIHTKASIDVCLAHYVAHATELDTEMSALAACATLGPHILDTLPVILPSLYEGAPELEAKYTQFAAEFGGIFDAAPHGQYLGGWDPRVHTIDPIWNNHPGSVNKFAPYDVSKLNYDWRIEAHSGGLRRPYVSAKSGPKDTWYPLLLVHVHCKDLARFQS